MLKVKALILARSYMQYQMFVTNANLSRIEYRYTPNDVTILYGRRDFPCIALSGYYGSYSQEFLDVARSRLKLKVLSESEMEAIYEEQNKIH